MNPFWAYSPQDSALQVKEKFQNKLKIPKPKKMGPREQSALLVSSRVGIKPICPSRYKVSSHDMGKGSVIATIVKEGAIPVWR